MSVRRTLVFLILCLLLPVTLFAQSSNGSISGTITDDSGGALPGVTVTAVGVETGAIRTAISNAAGYYQLALLKPGGYRVEAALEGFQPVQRDRVVVNVGTDVTLNLTLRVGVAESVTVTAAAPLIETERTQVARS